MSRACEWTSTTRDNQLGVCWFILEFTMTRSLSPPLICCQKRILKFSTRPMTLFSLQQSYSVNNSKKGTISLIQQISRSNVMIAGPFASVKLAQQSMHQKLDTTT